MSDKLTAEKFLADVKNHRLTIMHDSETMRCLRLAEPNTSHYHFNLTTWPGYLCISGDMGCFVFARVPDMFTFFRDGELKINADYWGEKVQAEDRSDGVKEFSPTMFRDAVERWLKEAEAGEDLREAVKDSVLYYADEGETFALSAVHSFVFNDVDSPQNGWDFQDFCEATVHDFTRRFLWCCYAIVWGIQQYDAAKGTPTGSNGSPIVGETP